MSGCACARISPSRWIEAGSDTYPDSDTGSGSDSEFGSESCRYMHMHMHMRMHMNMNANRTPTCVSAIDPGDEENSYVCSRWMDREDGVAPPSREALPGPRSNDDVSGRLSEY